MKNSMCEYCEFWPPEEEHGTCCSVECKNDLDEENNIYSSIAAKFIVQKGY